MMTRRITLTIAAAILGLILIGVLVFAATGTSDGATTDAAGTDTATTNETEAEPAEANGGGEATTPATTPAAAEEAGIDGSQLYATHCASCHGDLGQGGSGGPVDDLTITLDEVANITANGVPRMPAFADTLTVEEIEAVSEHTILLSES